MKWINSTGGPLLLLPAQVLQQWNGWKPILGSETTDYDRACEVALADYVDVLSVGGKDGLVLGDEPMQTTWLPLEEGAGGLFVRWMYADDESLAIQHLKSIPDEIFELTSLQFHVRQQKLLLFDSAAPGSEVQAEETLEIDLIPGTYSIETATFKPDNSTAFILHRLLLGIPA